MPLMQTVCCLFHQGFLVLEDIITELKHLQSIYSWTWNSERLYLIYAFGMTAITYEAIPWDLSKITRVFIYMFVYVFTEPKVIC